MPLSSGRSELGVSRHNIGTFFCFRLQLSSFHVLHHHQSVVHLKKVICRRPRGVRNGPTCAGSRYREFSTYERDAAAASSSSAAGTAAAADAAAPPAGVSLHEALFGQAPSGNLCHHRRLRLRRPAVFSGLARSWPAMGWSPAALAATMGERQLMFRVGPKRRAPESAAETEPEFETECGHVLATVAEFVAWVGDEDGDDEGAKAGDDDGDDDGVNERVGDEEVNKVAGDDGVNERVGDEEVNKVAGDDGVNERVGDDGVNEGAGDEGVNKGAGDEGAGDDGMNEGAKQGAGDDGVAAKGARRTARGVGALRGVSRRDSWLYADYMHMALLFRDHPDLLKGLRWEELGFLGRNGADSTLWLGSEGANTPCHFDTYGFNLVLQIYGRKRWHLFPPGDSPFLQPTRVPYEESSVFSRVHPLSPGHRRSQRLSRAHHHRVTLSPGQILFVPPLWWHYVESLDQATVSANTWVELESDHEARLQEALARIVVCAIKTQPHPDNMARWLNPSEDDDVSYETNLRYLNAALRALPGSSQSEAGPGRHGGSCRAKKRKADEPALDSCSCSCRRQTTGGESPSEDHEGGGAPSMPCGAFLVPLDPGSDSPTFDPEPAARESQGVAAGRGDVAGGTGEAVAVDTDTLLECVAHPDVVREIARLLRQRLRV
ncbi:HSPB1-associated protein 1 isoform X2 [Petromyzon marinus]|uniref:HSPB1-associated protein 1 isoform X2 n=1 Tax=Petromyzon marinus TaxID=7757 RepID=UPI003F6EEFDB